MNNQFKFFLAAATMAGVLGQQAKAMDVILLPGYVHCVASQGSEACRYWSATGELLSGTKETRIPFLTFLAALPFALPFTILNDDGSVAKHATNDEQLRLQGYTQEEIAQYHLNMKVILNKFSDKIKQLEASQQKVTVEDYRQTVYDSNPSQSTLEIMGL